MINWNELTLFLFILMRMTGFVLLTPFFGRRDIPGYFKAGFILLLSVTVKYSYTGSTYIPDTMLELAIRLLLELGLGFIVGMVIHFFFYIPQQAGEIIDTQMGMSMAKTYDASSQDSLTPTATFMHLMMMLTFFVVNGHITLLRIMLTSGDIIPFGAAAFGDMIANRMVEIFCECTLLSIKLALPILAAELIGQVGMGILMKVIPQINVFAINIELKVIIGLVMILLLVSPINSFLLTAESNMLKEIENVLRLAG